MKNRTILLIVLFVLTILYFAPLILNQRHYQTLITRELSKTFGVEFDVDDIGWHWLPLPAFSLVGVNAESESFSIEVPSMLTVGVSSSSPIVGLSGSLFIKKIKY